MIIITVVRSPLSSHSLAVHCKLYIHQYFRLINKSLAAELLLVWPMCPPVSNCIRCRTCWWINSVSVRWWKENAYMFFVKGQEQPCCRAAWIIQHEPVLCTYRLHKQHRVPTPLTISGKKIYRWIQAPGSLKLLPWLQGPKAINGRRRFEEN